MRREVLYRNKPGWHSPAVNPSFRRKSDHMLCKHLFYFYRLVAFSYMAVSLSKLLRAYFHQRWKHISKTSIVFFTLNKPAVIRQQQICLCSRKRTSAGIQYQISRLAKLIHKARHPFHRILLRPQQNLPSQIFSRPTTQFFLWKNTQNVFHHSCPPGSFVAIF